MRPECAASSVVAPRTRLGTRGPSSNLGAPIGRKPRREAGLFRFLGGTYLGVLSDLEASDGRAVGCRSLRTARGGTSGISLISGRPQGNA
jgi:hypothetical protein